jgi:UDP-N-acetylglucosamine acyltransferase
MRVQSFLIAGFLGLILLKYTPLQGAVLNSKIHPSAHIHSSVIMEGDIEVGANTVIGAHSYLKGPLVIGSDNQIGPHVMIGVDPEHKTKKGLGCVRIGNGNTIREFSVIQRGTGDLETQVDNDCYIMAYSYIAHDSLIESDVILCARVSLSGHCHVLKGAVLGLACSAHQFTMIGAHAFVGMGSIVVKDVPPFCIVIGNPAHFARFNLHPLEKMMINPNELKVEDGSLESTHAYVKNCLESFKTHVRRKVTPIHS